MTRAEGAGNVEKAAGSEEAGRPKRAPRKPQVVATGPVHPVRGTLLAAAGGVCWGFSGTAAQLLTSEMGVPVAWITPVRLCMAAVVLLVFCALKCPGKMTALARDRATMGQIVLFALLGVLFTQFSYLSAIAYTNSGIGTMMERLGLLLIMGYTCLRGRRLPYAREGAGVAVALLAVFLMATQGDPSSLSMSPEGFGWGLMAALAMAFYTLLPAKPLAKYGSFVVPAFAMAIAGVVAMVLTRPWTMDVDVTPQVAAVMVAMVLVGTVGAYLMYLQGIADAGPVRASLAGCMEPVSAMVISAVWLHTPFSGFDVASLVLIIAMVVLVTLPGKRKG